MSIEAMKLALEALEGADMIDYDMREAITALKALADQPAQQEHNELATALYQARYALRDYDAKQPNCGFGKLANFCQQAADLLLAEKPAQQEQVNKYCCHLCFNRSGQMSLDRMILCPECGNKRCTKATHHELQCTQSNDPAPQPAQQEPLTVVEIQREWRSANESVVDFARAIEAAHGIKE